MESILTSIKKMLGIDEECTDFDIDIIVNINSVFGILNQIGAGPKEGFSINNASTEWYEYINDDKKISMIKTYMFLKVKSMFDPPTIGSVVESSNKLINELEWRIRTEFDYNN